MAACGMESLHLPIFYFNYFVLSEVISYLQVIKIKIILVYHIFIIDNVLYSHDIFFFN